MKADQTSEVVPAASATPVPPAQAKRLANDLVGAAGVHFVAMRLSLRGLIALPTIRNTAGLDLLVSRPGGLSLATLQVKTSQRRVRFWPAPRPEKCLTKPNAFYVFLRWLSAKETFEGFLVPGAEVAKQVAENLKKKQQRGSEPFYWWELPKGANEEGALRKRWEDRSADWLSCE